MRGGGLNGSNRSQVAEGPRVSYLEVGQGISTETREDHATCAKVQVQEGEGEVSKANKSKQTTKSTTAAQRLKKY